MRQFGRQAVRGSDRRRRASPARQLAHGVRRLLTRWRDLQPGVALTLAYLAAVLLSRDYPADILTWQVPDRLAGSYQWRVLMTAMPPAVAGLLLTSHILWPSRRALAVAALLGLAALAETVSALASDAVVHSLSHHAIPHLALWILFVALVSAPSERGLRWLAYGLIFVVLAQSATALVQGVLVTLPALFGAPALTGWYVGISDPALGRIPRVAGLTAWPTILASLLASTAPLAFLLNGRAKQVAVGGVACAALLLSFGRAGWLGLAAGCLIGSAVLLGRARARRYAALGALCVLAVGALVGIQPRTLADVMDAIPLAPGQVNQSERAFAHDVALELWEGDPLLGVGPGNTAVTARHHPAYATLTRRIVPAHNWLILGLAERGLIGAALLALLWCGPVLWLLFRGQGRADAALAACLTALMVSQWFDYELTYWIGGSLIQVALLALWVRPPAMPS